MTDSRVSLLHKITSCLPQSDNNESLKFLRSFYLMRCKETTLEYRLPIKPFLPKVRCPHCCLEWDKKTDVVIKPIKLSARQKQRIKSKRITNLNENKVNIRRALLQSNQLEQICSFCKHTTVTTLPKPDKEYPKKANTSYPNIKTAQISEEHEQKAKKHVKETASVTNKNKSDKKKHVESSKKNISNTNVYSNAFDVFSLKNKQNTLASTIKEPPKVIKNNKKKKDKFAGLCQKAVLASAKLKQDNRQDNVQNKLSLFLKPTKG